MGAQRKIELSAHKPAKSEMKNAFQNLAQAEFNQRDISGPEYENVAFTLREAQRIVKIADAILSNKKRTDSDYPGLPNNPFQKKKGKTPNRAENEDKYNEKFVQYATTSYELFKYMAADVRADSRRAEILLDRLVKTTAPLSKYFAQKVEGGPTIAAAIRSKNAEKIRNLEALQENLEGMAGHSKNWALQFESLADNITKYMAKMGGSPKIQNDLKSEMREKFPKINAEVSEYEQGLFEQLTGLSEEGKINDPEVMSEHLLDFWENVIYRSHNVLKNAIRLASLSAAFLDVHGNDVVGTEFFNKPANLQQQVGSVETQSDFLQQIILDYKATCLEDHPLLFTREFHTPAEAGVEYAGIPQKPNALEA